MSTRVPMHHRDRVAASLSHKEPDRVPMDLGGSRFTMLLQPALAGLARHLGYEGDLVAPQRGRSAVAPPESILKQLDVDCRGIWLNAPDARPPRFIDDRTYVDEWGLTNKRLPEASSYEIVNSPLAGDVSVGDLRSYPWPIPDDPGRTRGLRAQALRLREETACAVVLSVGMPFLHYCQQLRGFSDWYIDMAADHRLAAALMDRVLDINISIYDAAFQEVGDVVDVVALGDDLGIQTGLMISPETYRKLIKPRQRRVFDLIHSKTGAKIMFHSCGSVYELLGDFVDVGVDALNPVQVSAEKMDTKTLKREWGDKLSFWGAIDTQRVMPYGSVEDVRDEVKRRVDDLAPGGGYVLAAVHNIQPEVPPENITAMLKACVEFGDYDSPL